MGDSEGVKVRPEMVGRDQELEFLVGRLGEALRGQGSVVLLAGEAGLGKTRLCEEFEKIARSTGFQVLIGNCIPGIPIPYLPFEEAFLELAGGKESFVADADSKAREVPSECSLTKLTNIDRPTSVSEGGGQPRSDERIEGLRSKSERTLFSTLDLLRSLSRENPLTMRLEDLHWADSASAQLLHFLARNVSGMRVLIVGTYRPEDLSADDPEKISPLLESLRAMKREGICQELKLDKLQTSELDEIVRGMFEDPVDEELLRRIAAESEGNPLCAIEIAKLLVVSNAIAMREGIWKADELEAIDIPPTMKEVILRRIERVPRKDRRILEAASAIGKSFEVALLQDAFSYDPIALMESLESIEKDHQLIRSSESCCEFTHERIRHVLYEGIPEIRKKEIHRLVGQSLENRLPNDALLLELSNHFCKAGVNRKCIDYSLLAGESCLKRYALVEAKPLMERVVERARADPESQEKYLRALEALGTIHVEFSNYRTAVSYFEEFIANARKESDRARVLRKEAECWVSTRLGKGDNCRFDELVKTAESIPGIEANDVGEILSMRSMISMWEGRLDDADRLMTSAEGIFKSVGNEDRLALQYAYHVVIPISKGLISEAITRANEVIAIFEKLRNPSGMLEVRNYLGIAYLHCGQLESAKESLKESIEMAEKIGDQVGLCWGHIYLSIIHDEEGLFESALIEAEKAKKSALATESEYMLSAANATLANELLRLNRLAEAESICREIDDFATRFEWKIGTPVRGLITIALAELLRKKKTYLGSNELFENAIGYFQGGYYCGLIHETIARIRYAESLIEQGECRQALGQLGPAGEISTRMGNEIESTRIEELTRLAMSRA